MTTHKKSQICFLLSVLVFITSCMQQDKTPHTGAEHQKMQVAQPAQNNTAGDPSFAVPHDTISTHGPQSITRNVLQDINGNFWLATWEGIIRYEPASGRFTNITLKEGLKHWHIFSLLEDKTGKLWFGTIGGGVYCYDGKSYTLFTTSDLLGGNSVMAILEDNAGNIWFGTDGGVSRYNASSGGFITFTTKDGLSNNFVSSIAQDKSGKLWFGTNSGVNCYDGKSITDFKLKEGNYFHNVRFITEDKTGNIWIAGQEGLFCYNPASGALPVFIKDGIYYIIEDKTGNLWMSGGELNSSAMTLFRYDGKSFTKIADDKQVFGIIQDISGNIWFGTANGVCCYDGKTFNKF